MASCPGSSSRPGSLARATAAGNLGEARRLWLAAHAGYERLGAAYDAFGDLDGVINGRPSGLPRGGRDPDFTGFHRVELALWHPETTSPSERRRQAEVLADAVSDLRDELANAQLDPLTFSIRAHEIAENLLQAGAHRQTPTSGATATSPPWPPGSTARGPCSTWSASRSGAATRT